MRTERIVLAAAGLMLGLAFTPARADDAKVDNPVFAAWSKFDAGASCSYEADMGPADHKMHLVATFSLKGKTADTVTVEIASTLNGTPAPAETLSIPAKIVVADVKKTGRQDVKIGDKTYKCTVYELGPSAMGATATAKPGEKMTAYISEDVPGGIVKMSGPASDGQDVAFLMTSCKTK